MLNWLVALTTARLLAQGPGCYCSGSGTPPMMHLAASLAHLDMLAKYCRTESIYYSLLRQVLISNSQNKTAAWMLDVGANHGLFGLLAAGFGANVIAFEPQRYLAELNAASWKANCHEPDHPTLAHACEASPPRFRVVNAAVLERPTTVRMSHTAKFQPRASRDGGTSYAFEDTNMSLPLVGGDLIKAHADEIILSNAIALGGAYRVRALPLADAIKVAVDEMPHVSFLKVDVEGAELAVLRSVMALCGLLRIDHVLVEFGPPSRWATQSPCGDADTCSTEALGVLTAMLRHGFEVMLMCIPHWEVYCRSIVKGDAKGLPYYASLHSRDQFKAVIQEMRKRSGAGLVVEQTYLWFCNPRMRTGCKAVSSLKLDRQNCTAGSGPRTASRLELLKRQGRHRPHKGHTPQRTTA